ncbi:N-acetylmuramoyl-L-alanine amidase [Helicobacter sp. MIT 21-1697]|uniref:N-acetylmuramoyl-L-alanine amidase family protein n=1 Tax=Helicobacter sp. MIT 21-1697 TaxID=2993733 RepID=UPI00224B0AEA|nr:N-acetylmuramoyl-L-alanine amidase [Helicobacter sp. MIT 21-1697]MCX2716975.1 N-acetylmuramoyl-L-alanine amidase [Helicobacter sp. MIT 21-1697]
MLRILAILFLTMVCMWGEHRIVKMVPFGDGNLKIVFAQDIAQLQWQVKELQDNKSFVDFEANLTLPRRNFIFKDNSTLQVAQNTPKIVRIVINIQPKSTFDIIKEKENLYIMIKPVQQEEKKPTPKPIPLDSKNTQNPPQATENKISQDTQMPKATNKNHKTNAAKKIVIDAGHGGKDCGTKSVEGICEKVIVLEVVKLLAPELRNRGYVVYMTRNTDIYIDLRKRTEFANAKNADLFVSVHANSMPKGSPKTPSGVETYFLSPARSERAEQVAKAENQGDIETMSHFATKSFLNTISAFHLVASHKLAIEIQSSILNQVREKYNTHDGAVREGPFWVLAGALMPSVLIEIGYASHKDEGKLIAKKDYQKLIAKGIADGIDGYFLRNY